MIERRRRVAEVLAMALALAHDTVPEAAYLRERPNISGARGSGGGKRMTRTSDVGAPAQDKRRRFPKVRERQGGCGQQGMAEKKKSGAAGVAVAAVGSAIKAQASRPVVDSP